MERSNGRARLPLWGRRDVWIVLTALLSALLLWLWFSRSGEGTTAVVSREGRELYRIDLPAVTEPYRIELDGDYCATLLVEHGAIRFEQADCPDQLCVRTGRLTRAGEAAVCLPAEITVQIEGGGRDTDAFTG